MPDPTRPVLPKSLRRRLMTALDRRAATVSGGELDRAMQGVLTDDGMVAGEAIHWDPADPAAVGGTVGGDLEGSLPGPTVVGFRGVPLKAGAPADRQVYQYSAAEGKFVLVTPSSFARYRQYAWETDGAGDWSLVQEDDGSGQIVPTLELLDLE